MNKIFLLLLLLSLESSNMAEGILLTYVNTEEVGVTTGSGIFMPQYSPLCDENFEKSVIILKAITY